jgi:DNA polymerase-1
VEQWQREQCAYAAKEGYVNTMVGRRRGLRPGINSTDKWVKARMERLAINTPIQGSAADVASAAMLSIVQDRWLQENGWTLLLQVGGVCEWSG